jgi:hypothetical protein
LAKSVVIQTHLSRLFTLPSISSTYAGTGANPWRQPRDEVVLGPVSLQPENGICRYEPDIRPGDFGLKMDSGSVDFVLAEEKRLREKHLKADKNFIKRNEKMFEAVPEAKAKFPKIHTREDARGGGKVCG